jgi:anti-sigma regulatory factor (Ser/Thr protein kinase)
MIAGGSGSCKVVKWQRRVDRPMPEGGYSAVRLGAGAWLRTHPVVGVDVNDVQLALSELVSNAIRHGSGPVDIELVADAGTLRLNVSDSSDVMPRQPADAGFGPGGRGLMLVGKLATGWAADQRPGGGKTVWCEFNSPTVVAPAVGS